MSIAYATVTCATCGKQYVCTPIDDYYHKPELPVDERTTTNGYCETCLVSNAGLDPNKTVEHKEDTS